jgi:hypothetical protein
MVNYLKKNYYSISMGIHFRKNLNIQIFLGLKNLRKCLESFKKVRNFYTLKCIKPLLIVLSLFDFYIKINRLNFKSKPKFILILNLGLGVTQDQDPT